MGGTGAGQSGTVVVTGTATLANTLRVTLVNGYSPASGDAIPILTFAAETGTFSTLAGDGGLFTPAYDPMDVTLTAN